MKDLFKNPIKKRLLTNFFSLSILQATNYILPLITLPYLVRVLLPEKFGLLAFAQALIQYFSMFTDYGFNFSATREISVKRKDVNKVSEIFSAVMALKILFTLLSLIILSVIIFSFQKFRQEYIVYFLSFGLVIGQNMFPRWLFQGLERMKYITIINLIAKAVFTLGIFIFIKDTNDYVLVPLINSLGYILSGIISLWIVFHVFKIKASVPTLQSLKYQLKEGGHLFISTFATSLYVTSNTFILGIFANNTIVGFYSAAEKIIKAIEDILSPVFHSLYPYLSTLVNESKQAAIIFIKKIVKLIAMVAFLISLFVFIFPDFIVTTLLGHNYSGSIIVLKILAFIPLIGGLNIIFTSLTLLSFNYKRAFTKIILIAGIFNLICSFVLVPLFQHIGSSISVVFSELFIMVTTFIFLRREGISLIGR